MKRSYWILAGIVVVAIVLRLLAINTRDIQYDDAFTILLSSRSLADIVSGTAADTMPPLFYFILHFWGSIIDEIWFYRVLSILFNLGAMFGVYTIASRVSPSSGIWSAFLFAISPLQIYHSQDIRMYAFLELCLIWYLYFSYRLYFSESNPSNRLLFNSGLIITGICALYTHNIAGFMIIIPSAVLVLLKKWKSLLDLAGKQLIILFLFIPWLLVLPGQVGKISTAFWTPRPGLLEVVQAVILWHSSLPLPGQWIAAGTGISVLIFIFVIYLVIRNPQPGNHKAFLVFAAFLPPVLLFGLSYLMRPLFVPRVFIASQAIYLVLAGVIISKTSLSWIKYGIAGLFLAAALIGNLYQIQYDKFPRSPHRQAAKSLEELDLTNAIIVHDNKLSFFPFHVHSPDLFQTYLADEPGNFNDTLATQTQAVLGLMASKNIQIAVDNKEMVVFVTYDEVFVEYSEIGQEHPNFTWLNDRFLLKQENIFNDLHLFYFIEED